MKTSRNNRPGFTLMELAVVSLMVTTSALAVGTVFSEAQKSWNQTYTRCNSHVLLDSHVAQRAFESVVRKSTVDRYLVAADGSWVKLYYYNSPTSPKVDRYAKFYAAGGALQLEYGASDPDVTHAVVEVCPNVTACTFSGSGRCIRMQATLSANGETVTLAASAVPQNY